MTNRPSYSPHGPDHKLSSLAASEPAAAYGSAGIGSRAEGRGDSVHAMLQQLTQSLTVLSSASELILEGRATTTSGQALRVWLQPNARQAELTMHRLRAARPIRSPAQTELSQCLTVLVLAADMLAQGQLTGADARTFYGLLRRNADGAMRSLNELRAQLEPEALAEHC